jgi:hypothetical protein
MSLGLHPASTKDIWISTLRSPGINHVGGSTSAGTYFRGPAELDSRPPTAPQMVPTHSPSPPPSILHSPSPSSAGILISQNRLLRRWIGFPPNPPPFEIRNIHQLATAVFNGRAIRGRCALRNRDAVNTLWAAQRGGGGNGTPGHGRHRSGRRRRRRVRRQKLEPRRHGRSRRHRCVRSRRRCGRGGHPHCVRPRRRYGSGRGGGCARCALFAAATWRGIKFLT